MEEIQKQISLLFVLIDQLQNDLLKSNKSPVHIAVQILKLRDAKLAILELENKIKGVLSSVSIEEIFDVVSEFNRDKKQTRS